MPIKISNRWMPLAANGTIIETAEADGEGWRTVTGRLRPSRRNKAISALTNADLLENGCDCPRQVVATHRSELLP
jgi:hypothetical protein